MKLTLRTKLDWLLDFRGYVRACDLAEHLSISNSVACRHLARLVKTGELVKVGAGRGSKYIRSTDSFDRLTQGYGRALTDFWLRLQQSVRSFEYVKLSDFGVELRRREQVRELLQRAENFSFVIIDFEGIDDASDAFLDELVTQWSRFRSFMVPKLINANDQIARRIRRLEALPEPPPPGSPLEE